MVTDKLDKGARDSKKWIAMFFIECVLFVALILILGTCIITGAPLSIPVCSVLLGIILVIGFIGAGYVLSVAALEKYVGVAEVFKGNWLNKKDNTQDDKEV